MSIVIFFLNCPVDIPCRAFLRRRIALVIELLALCQRNIKLDILPGKMHVKRHKRIPVACNLSQKTEYLSLVQKKPSYTQGILVENVSLFVRRDVHPVDEQLPAVYLAVAFLKIYLSLTDAFYFCSAQLYARLDFFFYEILVVRLLVLCEYSRALFLHNPYPPA